jgi:hypothetical protein
VKAGASAAAIMNEVAAAVRRLAKVMLMAQRFLAMAALNGSTPIDSAARRRV